MAVASATTCASFERAMTQPAVAAPNTRHRLTSRDTATETVVKPPPSLKKSEIPKNLRRSSSPHPNPAVIATPNPFGPDLFGILHTQQDSVRIACPQCLGQSTQHRQWFRMSLHDHLNPWPSHARHLNLPVRLTPDVKRAHLGNRPKPSERILAKMGGVSLVQRRRNPCHLRRSAPHHRLRIQKARRLHEHCQKGEKDGQQQGRLDT